MSKMAINPQSGAGIMEVIGNTLQEQKTEAAAVGGVITFSKPVNTIEIYNTDLTNTGNFIVNGISIKVPSNKVYKSTVAGTLSNTVTVTGSTSYIVSRYT